MEKPNNTVKNTLRALQTLFRRAGDAPVEGILIDIMSDGEYILGLKMKMVFETGWIPEDRKLSYLDDRDLLVISEQIDLYAKKKEEDREEERSTKKTEYLH